MYLLGLVLLLHLPCIFLKDDLFLFLDVGQFFLQLVPSEVIDDLIGFQSFHHAQKHLPVHVGLLQLQSHAIEVILQLFHFFASALLLLLEAAFLVVEFLSFFLHLVDCLLEGFAGLAHVVVFFADHHQVLVC